MSHPTARICRSCRFVLGQVRDGVLRPLVPVASVDGRGVARVPCPRCGRVRMWFPAAPAATTSVTHSRRPGQGNSQSRPSSGSAWGAWTRCAAR
jgi:hypothetical protein